MPPPPAIRCCAADGRYSNPERSEVTAGRPNLPDDEAAPGMRAVFLDLGVPAPPPPLLLSSPPPIMCEYLGIGISSSAMESTSNFCAIRRTISPALFVDDSAPPPSL